MLDKVFEELTGVPFVCKELGLTGKNDYHRVNQWRERGVVPPKFRGEFFDMCKKYNVEVTLNQLAGDNQNEQPQG